MNDITMTQHPVTVLPFIINFGYNDHSHDGLWVLPDHIFTNEKGIGWINASDLHIIKYGDKQSPVRSGIVGFRDSLFKIALEPGKYQIDFICGGQYVKNYQTSVSILNRAYHLMPSQGRTNEIWQSSIRIETVAPSFEIHFFSPVERWIINKIIVRGISQDEVSIRYDYIPGNRWPTAAPADAVVDIEYSLWQKNIEQGQSGFIPVDREPAYLDMIEVAVDGLKADINDKGVMIDRFLGREFQYATPCFAYISALLVRHRNRTDLLPVAKRSLLYAAQCLGTRKAADGHEDFFPSPIAHAIRLLAGNLDQTEHQSIRNILSGYNPYHTYRKPVGGKLTEKSGSNWNCLAAAGEYALYKLGYKSNFSFTSNSILGQGNLFDNEFGIYSEGPTTYDAFARAWLSDMLEWGYDGPGFPELTDALDRGALTSLFMQSPTGELPPGGRSSQHTWSDALQCLVFESAARRSADKNDLITAGRFKLAARQALTAVKAFQNRTGDLQIVKNHVEHASRHGYEVYSSFSQYNTLALTALGFAYESSLHTADTKPAAIPSLTGTSILEISSDLDKIIGNAYGTHVVISRTKIPHQTPAGLLRINFYGIPSYLPISDGTLKTTNHALPEGPRTDISTGLAWLHDHSDAAPAVNTDLLGRPIQTVAELDSNELQINLKESSRTIESLAFLVQYDTAPGLHGPHSILERYFLAKDRIEINYSWQGWDKITVLRVPVFHTDGQARSELMMNADSLDIKYLSHNIKLVFSAIQFTLRLGESLYPFRNGYFRLLECEINDGDEIGLAIYNNSGK